ncbi:hypothetical protein N566_20125 [Streptomycetaceae bacterium MP113-05]|nr:hypothetical protein N566_20125 [Streptomycetaceae bacterium MP113-05]
MLTVGGAKAGTTVSNPARAPLGLGMSLETEDFPRD